MEEEERNEEKVKGNRVWWKKRDTKRSWMRRGERGESRER